MIVYVDRIEEMNIRGSVCFNLFKELCVEIIVECTNALLQFM